MNYVDFPIPVPIDSAELRKQTRSISPQNPGLIFDHYIPIDPVLIGQSEKPDARYKQKAMKEVQSASQKIDESLLAAWNQRWEQSAKAVHAEIFSMKTNWRLIVGLGQKGILEAGFTFNRYGFPVLPGSSLKGLARNWALLDLAEKLHMDEKDIEIFDDLLGSEVKNDDYWNELKLHFSNIQDEEQNRNLVKQFVVLFGTPAGIGKAIFLDAIPKQKPVLDLDIMTPHYQKYYSGSEFPTDSQKLNPIPFIAVAPNTEFRFAVGWRGILLNEDKKMICTAKNNLVNGLKELGAGAKTSSGYGYFKEDQA